MQKADSNCSARAVADSDMKMRICSSASIAENHYVVGIPFVMVCRIESLCPTKQGVSRKRWNKAGSFVPMAIGIGFCVSALCALQMGLTWCVGY